MSKVTSKLQVTVPKAIAARFRIQPGDEIEWIAAGDVIRIEPVERGEPHSIEERTKLFDQATKRLRRHLRRGRVPASRGWTREELYERGRAR